MKYFIALILFFGGIETRADILEVEGKTAYNVTVARTKSDLQKGLMFVKNLPENTGMLFDLRDYPGSSMWMKNTYIALDMVFIDCDFKIVDFYRNARPLSLEKIGSSEDFCYILEINGGEAAKNKLTVGDVFTLRQGNGN